MRFVTVLSASSLLVLLFSSCKKDENNPVPAAIVVKYEIRVSDPVKDTSANNSVTIQYVNGAGQTVTASGFTAGMTVWSKTDTVKTSTRPLNLTLSQSADVFLMGPGNIYGSITVNGGIRAFYSESTINLGSVHRARISPLSAEVN